jgi:Sec-independent protein translocase protein TatA
MVVWLHSYLVVWFLIWLITLFLFFNKKARPVVIKTNDNLVNLKAAIKAVKNACKTNDAQAAKQALMTWGHIQYATSNLGALANHCEARLRDEILILNQNLYSQHPDEWHGQSLFQFFSEHNARIKIDSKISDDVLEPLYRI